MFDFSFAEGLVISFIGLLVLGPKDISKLIKYSKGLIANIKKHSSEFINQFDEDGSIEEIKKQAQDINNEVKTIIDLDGNEHIAYELDDIVKEIESYKREKDK